MLPHENFKISSSVYRAVDTLLHSTTSMQSQDTDDKMFFISKATLKDMLSEKITIEAIPSTTESVQEKQDYV